MPPVTTKTIPDDARGLDRTAIPDEYERRNLATASDDRLFEMVAEVVSEPRADPANSFVLHAPLELLARRALLEYVEPARRQRARLIWVELAAEYEAAGDAQRAREAVPFDSVGAATSRLGAALDAGDLDGVDDSAAWLARRATAADLIPLADSLVTRLGAAAHAPIYLYTLPRVAPRSHAAIGLLRPLVRELAREPDWHIEWVGRWTPAAESSELTDALLDTPRLGLPGSDFIYPLMHQVDASGVAAEVVGPALGAHPDGAATSRSLARVAAWSMLQDDRTHAPYGWTHCLTLAQAAAGVAAATSDPTRALAVAATHVVGFRAALSASDVAPRFEPDAVPGPARDALDAPPPIAAAAVHHASTAELEAIATELANRAALHEDAHVVKYTLACLDAAAADPGERRLFLAAAASLLAWWGQEK